MTRSYGKKGPSVLVAGGIVAAILCIVGTLGPSMFWIQAAVAATDSWSITPSPSPGGNFNLLNGVACVSGGPECMAVGYAMAGSTLPSGASQTLIEASDGNGWAVVPSPNPSGNTTSELLGITCVTVDYCVAVGDSSGASEGTLVESWDGTAWSIVPSPNANQYDVLYGVSCTGVKNCVAVGYSGTGQFQTALIESWNGSVWSIVPNPASTSSAAYILLEGVSCIASNSCIAVGFNDVSEGATFVEAWNGNQWSIVPSPTPSGGSAYLDSVSCLAVDNCTAVGSSNSGTMTLVESWNGTAWSIVSSPTQAGAALNTLNGVSCLSLSYCTAVGSSSPAVSPPAPQTLVETWNGTAWALTPSPDVEGSSNVTIQAFSGTQPTGGMPPAAVRSLVRPEVRRRATTPRI